MFLESFPIITSPINEIHIFFSIFSILQATSLSFLVLYAEQFKDPCSPLRNA